MDEVVGRDLDLGKKRKRALMLEAPVRRDRDRSI